MQLNASKTISWWFTANGDVVWKFNWKMRNDKWKRIFFKWERVREWKGTTATATYKRHMPLSWLCLEQSSIRIENIWAAWHDLMPDKTLSETTNAHASTLQVHRYRVHMVLRRVDLHVCSLVILILSFCDWSSLSASIYTYIYVPNTPQSRSWGMSSVCMIDHDHDEYDNDNDTRHLYGAQNTHNAHTRTHIVITQTHAPARTRLPRIRHIHIYAFNIRSIRRREQVVCGLMYSVAVAVAATARRWRWRWRQRIFLKKLCTHNTSTQHTHRNIISSSSSSSSSSSVGRLPHTAWAA